MTWETIDQSVHAHLPHMVAQRTARLSVPGGWLYRTTFYSDTGVPLCTAMVLVKS